MFKELLELHQIHVHFFSSQHPDSLEMFHFDLIEHIKLLNNQDDYNNELIKIKVNYALLAYNNTFNLVTILISSQIIYGHLETTSPFNVALEKQLKNNYTLTHRNKIKWLYQKVNEKIEHYRGKIINGRNRIREEFRHIPQKVYIQDKQK